MLVFGPYRCAPKDGSFKIFNFTSPVDIQRLPGLFVEAPSSLSEDGELEKSFDMWYYNYVLNDPIACSSLMMILSTLYNCTNVYICIAEYSNGFINIINESFMKMIQSRYDIKYSIINEEEDLLYVSRDGCDFMSVQGIQMFDEDRKRFMQLSEEQRIMNGGNFVAY